MFKLLLMLVCALPLFATTPKDTLVIGVENETARINPLFDEDHDSALDFVFSGLTRFSPDMQIEPDLATSWEVSPNGLSWVFHLRKGVLWHDGKPFSAQDVKFTLEQAQNLKLNAPARANFTAIQSVQVLDPYTLKITLKAPFPPLLDVLSMGILPKHLLEGKDLNTDSFNQHPIGTGPFKFVRWQKGTYISFVANDKFYRGAPKAKKVILKIVPDFNVRTYEVKNGAIDVALVEPNLAKSLERDPHIKILDMKSADYRALMFNFDNPLLKSLAVRLAINYAIDRPLIAQKILHGYGFVANNPIQASWANDSHAQGYPYDPKKAREILKKDGWVLKDKVFYKNGKPLAFDIYAFNTDPLRVTLANILQSELAQVGIKATAIAKNHGAFEISKVDSFIIGWGSPLDPDLQTYRIFGTKMEWNYNHYTDKAIDLALNKARTTNNQASRKLWYAKFIQDLHDDPPFAFLVYLRYPLAYRSNIHGIKPTILGHHGARFTYNVAEWSKD
ncbi:Oligopeptide ABC transporter, periplasmic oligopeptide-binding protein OppA (TC 3.A.1.5.1) [Helicobacter ailurogastricus]|uniref:Oligopeptide ABC transporter, periplasmic oligopeptide-binding protein OppA (TC 3.A.1.5.1) n=2 Tax=Helicobacter ailurogastricus TaxID=1578720 RepID=A0A0K2XFV4_9HELI|nr:Oligopeptide ABC transporter, periplasmic oligopeptide-binding protein OppA (TC 3.A.1.5.1) [Helicobacter ailurogastricus]CRF43297.1 Oligopeptide ABC transporter, periplasmic oligopeptide-binding protein OppA (TC 3.A.1.5.1) [Helicobacter ailurogastricus]CRF44473.1 Oligopeptide ABC transporter, periplasmic oligopeptide-binding protein OppA (TC 3.A.1.5.1) [Helicobacter ailurogastricus]